MEKKTVDQLKKLGLQGLENISKNTVETLFAVIEIIVKDSENKIDDAILPLLPFIKEKIIQIVNKIDKEN